MLRLLVLVSLAAFASALSCGSGTVLDPVTNTCVAEGEVALAENTVASLHVPASIPKVPQIVTSRGNLQIQAPLNKEVVLHMGASVCVSQYTRAG